MLRSFDHRRMLVKAARCYYEAGLNQAEIAEQFGLSRQKVQRILREARDEGIVQITIKPLIGLFSDLESRLERQFGLAEAIVVETSTNGGPDMDATIAREVGVGAAEYLMRVIRPRDKIAISVGNALRGMVNALPYSAPTDATGLKVIQGLGGLGDPSHETHATQLVGRLAQALKAEQVLMGAPAVAGCRETRDTYLRDPQVARTLELARSADMMFVGIGSSNSDEVVVRDFWNVMDRSTLDGLRAEGAVGSINLRHFDRNGKLLLSEFDERIIGLTLEDLQKIHRTIGVAGGCRKCEAIRAALLGKLIKVLVTDHVTAQYLLNHEQ